MPSAPFNSLTLNYTGWPVETSGGGCGRGVEGPSYACVFRAYTRLLLPGGKIQKKKENITQM